MAVKVSASQPLENLLGAGVVTCIWFSLICTHFSLFDLCISSWLVGLALCSYRIHRMYHFTEFDWWWIVYS